MYILSGSGTRNEAWRGPVDTKVQCPTGLSIPPFYYASCEVALAPQHEYNREGEWSTPARPTWATKENPTAQKVKCFFGQLPCMCTPSYRSVDSVSYYKEYSYGSLHKRT